MRPTSSCDTDATAGRGSRGLLKLIGWLVGIGCLSLLGVLLIIGLMMGLALKSCSDALGDIRIGPIVVSGRDWCRHPAISVARPLGSMVDKATIGGDAFPITDASGFDAVRGLTKSLQGIRADVETVGAALEPGVRSAPNRNGYRIPPEKAATARAAALRLDAYCARVDP